MISNISGIPDPSIICPIQLRKLISVWKAPYRITVTWFGCYLAHFPNNWNCFPKNGWSKVRTWVLWQSLASLHTNRSIKNTQDNSLGFISIIGRKGTYDLPENCTICVICITPNHKDVGFYVSKWQVIKNLSMIIRQCFS